MGIIICFITVLAIAFIGIIIFDLGYELYLRYGWLKKMYHDGLHMHRPKTHIRKSNSAIMSTCTICGADIYYDPKCGIWEKIN